MMLIIRLIKKGYYKYNDYLSLQKNNVLKFDFSSFKNQQFYYYGADYIDPLYGEEYYISEEGSKIILYFEPFSEEDDQFVSQIYPNKNSAVPLNICKMLRIGDADINSIVYCDLHINEIYYFDSNLPMVYSVLCGSKESTSAIVHKLDKENYPLYRVKRLVIPDDQYVQDSSEFIMIADIEGSISGIDKMKSNTFGALIDIKNGEESNIKFLHCETPLGSSRKTNVELTCYPLLESSDYNKLKCETNNVYLYPLYYPKNTYNPYEVRINDNVEYINGNRYNPPSKIFRPRSENSLIKVSYYSIIATLLLLFL